MPFNSLGFLLFIGVFVLLWYILPAKTRPYLLLAASWLFIGLYSKKNLALLILYSAIVYGEGLLLHKKKNKGLLALCIAADLIPLFVFKYLNFSISIVDDILKFFGAGEADHRVNLLFIIGISYYSFKSLSYLIDIYKEKIEPEKNPFYLAAFVSFFPEMLVGPIDRAENLLVQIREKKGADWKHFQTGMLVLMGGYFEKMVVADRLGMYVDNVYANLTGIEGIPVFIAICFYSLQIYFDFSGCTHMVIGMGQLLGFNLPENFRQPYLAVSVADFWKRWHISLTDWLRDYLYIPLGGNRKGVVRKYVNMMIVFLISGLWHGAGLNFIVWGGLNGLFQIGGILLSKGKKKVYEGLKIFEDSLLLKWWKRIGTFILMTVCWTFFRADSLSQAILVFKQIAKRFNPWVLFDGSLFEYGLSQKNFHLALLLILLMVVYDLLCEAGHKPSEWIVNGHYLTKCVAFYLVVFAILVLGIYGTTQDWGNFIYVQF